MKRTSLIEYRGDRSQAVMATMYNVSQQAWQQWEQGITAPKAVIMKQLEKDSGIEMEKLFPDIFTS